MSPSLLLLATLVGPFPWTMTGSVSYSRFLARTRPSSNFSTTSSTNTQTYAHIDKVVRAAQPATDSISTSLPLRWWEHMQNPTQSRHAHMLNAHIPSSDLLQTGGNPAIMSGRALCLRCKESRLNSGKYARNWKAVAPTRCH